MEVQQTEAYTEVVELCALLQCLGFEVKSLESNEASLRVGGSRTITIDCEVSGVHVVLSSASTSCACLCCFGGKHFDKEFGSSLLASLPWHHRQHLSKFLAEVIRCIQHQPEPAQTPNGNEANRSASMLEMKTPVKRDLKVNADTPTRYRSLDTLTNTKEEIEELPTPGRLQKCHAVSNTSVNDNQVARLEEINLICGGVMRNKKPISIAPRPNPANYNMLYQDILDIEHLCTETAERLKSVIKKIKDDGGHDPLNSNADLTHSISPNPYLTIDETSTPKFASSPNLSSVGKIKETAMDRLKRVPSVSTSNLAKVGDKKEVKPSLLRRISPGFFKKKLTPITPPNEKTTPLISKRMSLPKAKILVPVQRTPTSRIETGGSLSSSKKYSHIKSTIPKPSKK